LPFREGRGKGGSGGNGNGAFERDQFDGGGEMERDWSRKRGR